MFARGKTLADDGADGFDRWNQSFLDYLDLLGVKIGVVFWQRVNDFDFGRGDNRWSAGRCCGKRFDPAGQALDHGGQARRLFTTFIYTAFMREARRCRRRNSRSLYRRAQISELIRELGQLHHGFGSGIIRASQFLSARVDAADVCLACGFRWRVRANHRFELQQIRFCAGGQGLTFSGVVITNNLLQFRSGH